MNYLGLSGEKRAKPISFSNYLKNTVGEIIGKGGAQGQNRTAHTGIFSPLLYRLSYLGTNGRHSIQIGFDVKKNFPKN